jgi:hypothetical protein
VGCKTAAVSRRATDTAKEILQRRKRTEPSTELDECAPDRCGNVYPDKPFPPKNHKPTKDNEEDESQVEHHYNIGKYTEEHGLSHHNDLAYRQSIPMGANRLLYFFRKKASQSCVCTELASSNAYSNPGMMFRRGNILLLSGAGGLTMKVISHPTFPRHLSSLV